MYRFGIQAKLFLKTVGGHLHDERGRFSLGDNSEEEDPQVSIETPPERHRIGKLEGVSMVSIALLFDGLQALFTFLLIGLLVNWIFTFLAWLLFYIWFRINDVGFFDTGVRKLITLFASVLIELIPGVNAIPAITLGLVILLIIVNSEDALYNRTRGKVDIRVT